MAEGDYKETLSLDVSNFLGGLQAAQVALGTFAGNIASQVIPALTNMATSIIDNAREFGKFAEHIENLGAATAISESHLLTMESVMDLVGGNVDSLGASVRILATRMKEADQGNVDMQANLALLGVKSRDPYTAMLQIADTLVKYKDNSNKVAAATELMGRGFAQILPALKDGSQAFAEAEQRAADFGTNLPLSRLKSMDDSFDKLNQSMKGFGRTLVDALSPAIEGVNTQLTTMIANFTSGFLKGNFLDSFKLNLKATIEEISTFFSFIHSGKFFFEGGRNQLSAEIDFIQAKYKKLLEDLRKTKSTPDREDDRPDIGVAEKHGLKVKAAEAELKNAEETSVARLKIAKGELETQKAFLHEQVQAREISESEAVQRIAVLDRQDIDNAQRANLEKLEAVSVFHQQRLKIGFGSVQELKAFEESYAATVKKVVAEIITTQEKADTQRLTSSKNILSAQEKDIKAGALVRQEGLNNEQKIGLALTRRELEDRLHFNEAMLTLYETDLRSYEQIAIARRDVTISQRDLAIHDAQAQGREIASIRLKFDALIEQEDERAQNGFVRGWQEAMHSYLNTTNSMFNLAVDMVRSMAQQMQSSFRTIFLDFFEDKIRTIKDLLRELGNFVKQVVADILARLATVALMKAAVGFFGGLADGTGGLSGILGGGADLGFAYDGGHVVKRFALGGPVLSNGDSVPALLTPGEFVISRTGMDALNRLNQGQTPFGSSNHGDVTVNIVGAGRDDKPTVNVHRQLQAMVVDIIWSNVRQNGSLRQLFAQ